MACTCVALTNEALAELGCTLDSAFLFDRATGATSVTVRLGTLLTVKKRGARAVNLIPTFCPFCGVRYQEEASGGC